MAHITFLIGITLLISAAIIAAIVLIGRIAFPTIVEYPWRLGTNEESRQLVVLAGSFNPPHLGHLAIIRYLSQRYGKVLVVIGFNPHKHYDVTPQQRQSLLVHMIESSGCYNVGVKGKKHCLASTLYCVTYTFLILLFMHVQHIYVRTFFHTSYQ
jgi:cytidyltransferase-like protein